MDANADQLATSRIIARIERLPRSAWQTRMRGLAGVAFFFDGFDALTIAFVLPALIFLWHLGPLDIGLLIATGYLGQAIGSVGFGWYAERVGRVPCAVASCAIFGIFSLACAAAPGFGWLVSLRFLQGIGLGGEMPVMQSYLNEFSATRRRGRFTLATQLPFAFGIFATSLVAAWVVPHAGWRWMFVIGALPALLVLGLRRVMPESPRWLATRGRVAEAEQVMDGIEAEITAAGHVLPPLPPLRPVAAQVGAARISTLFQGRYRRRTYTLWALWFSVYLVSYGLSAWMPSVYRTVYHLPVTTSLLYGAYTSGALFLGGVLVTLSIDSAGRKPWFIGALLVSGMVLALLYNAPAMVAGSVMLVSLVPFCLIGALSLLLGPYTAENYPTHLRAVGTGIGNAWLRIASVIGPFLVGWVLQAHGLGGVFVMFGIVALLGGAVALGFAAETKGKSLEELSPVEP